MNTNSIILVIGATREEALHIEKCLKDWEYEIVPLNDEGTGIEIPIPETSNLMLLYAQKEPENTIAICEQLRKDPKRATVTILLVIGRYKMSQFYELRRRMENMRPSLHHSARKIYVPGLRKFLGPLKNIAMQVN